MRRNQPSLTAIKVSRTLVCLGRDPKLRALLPPGAAEATERLLIAAGILKPGMLDSYRDSMYRFLLAAWSRCAGPAVALHLALRKRFFDDEVRAAIAQGARQVLVLAGGFDTLCMRLAPEYPAVQFIETDHPATHAAKRRGLERLSIHPPNLSLCAVDLAAMDLAEVLGGLKIWNREQKTVIQAEALFMYLEEARVSALLRAIHRMTRVGSRLLFSYVPADEMGRPQIGWLGPLTRLYLRLVGEPLLWSPRPRDLAKFLDQHGYHLDASPERVDLRLRYLQPAGLGDRRAGRIMELMASADTGRIGG